MEELAYFDEINKALRGGGMCMNLKTRVLRVDKVLTFGISSDSAEKQVKSLEADEVKVL